MKTNRKQHGFGIIYILMAVVCLAIICQGAFSAWRSYHPVYSHNSSYTEFASRTNKQVVNFIMGDFGTREVKSTQNHDKYAKLDVYNCPIGEDALYFNFGHTEFRILGKQADKCVFDYGTEVENPRWDGKLATECSVVTSFSQDLRVSKDNGIDFSPINSFCKAK